MLETSTVYLILAMAAFVIVAILMVHYHNCSELVRRKQNEVEAISLQLNKKIDILEQEVVDFKIKLDDLNDDIEAYQA